MEIIKGCDSVQDCSEQLMLPKEPVAPETAQGIAAVAAELTEAGSWRINNRSIFLERARTQYNLISYGMSAFESKDGFYVPENIKAELRLAGDDRVTRITIKRTYKDEMNKKYTREYRYSIVRNPETRDLEMKQELILDGNSVGYRDISEPEAQNIFEEMQVLLLS